jgi:hypothetical protein
MSVCPPQISHLRPAPLRFTGLDQRARKDEANPRDFATAGSDDPYVRTAAEIRTDEEKSKSDTARRRTKERATATNHSSEFNPNRRKGSVKRCPKRRTSFV